MTTDSQATGERRAAVSSNRVVSWFRVGKGRKLHAIMPGAVHAACSIGGYWTGPYANPSAESKCTECMRLTANDLSERTAAAAPDSESTSERNGGSRSLH